MGDALAPGEKEARSLLGIVLAHPALQIDVAHRQIRGVDQRGIARRDAVPSEGQFSIEDAVEDAFGAKPQLVTTWTVQRLRQAPWRRNRRRYCRQPLVGSRQ